MDEDLDELLEEIENKFLNKLPVDNIKKVKRKKFSPASSFSDDTLHLDDILPDVKIELPQPAVTLKTNPSKCFPLYVGGTDVTMGWSTVGTQRACNNLHCTTCDFAVSAFDNLKWTENTDYLFLRTNMPELERVKKCLRRTEGWRAYACQCHHFSTRKLQDVHSLPSLTWICMNH